MCLYILHIHKIILVPFIFAKKKKMKVQSMKIVNDSLFHTPQHVASCVIKIITTCIVICFHTPTPCWTVIFEDCLLYFKP